MIRGLTRRVLDGSLLLCKRSRAALRGRLLLGTWLAATPRRVWRQKRIAVVVPAFNEERLIARTVAGIPAYVDRVVVVDDASRDCTWDKVRALGQARVALIRHLHNQGVGAAIATGYYRALREGAEIIAVMAGDNQMRPDELSALLDTAIDGVDYAKGNRLLHASRKRMPRLRRLGSRALSGLTRAASGLSVGDCQCGFTALRAELAERLPLDDMWPRYGYPNDLLLLLAAAGGRVRDVPVSAVYADESSGLHAGHVVAIAYRIMRRAWQLRGMGSRPSPW